MDDLATDIVGEKIADKKILDVILSFQCDEYMEFMALIEWEFEFELANSWGNRQFYALCQPVTMTWRVFKDKDEYLSSKGEPSKAYPCHWNCEILPATEALIKRRVWSNLRYMGIDIASPKEHWKEEGF